MQVLLTEEEWQRYKNSADAAATLARTMADDYKKRLAAALIEKLTRGLGSQMLPHYILEELRQAFAAVPLESPENKV